LAIVKSHKKLILALLVAIAVVCVLVLFFWGNNSGLGYDVITVSCATVYNKTDNTIALYITSYENQTHTFNQAIIKNSDSHAVATINFDPVTLPAYGNFSTTLRLNEGVLASDKSYNVELYTIEGKLYTSYLTYYEEVKTQATVVNTNTLLVEIQSLSNQTITFDKATLNYWVPVQFSPDQASQMQQSEETVLSANNQLPPNGNLSFTLPFQRGFTGGTYSLILHTSTPANVDGAWAVFKVK
jgi:hypothetical protein